MLVGARMAAGEVCAHPRHALVGVGAPELQLDVLGKSLEALFAGRTRTSPLREFGLLVGALALSRLASPHSVRA